MGEFTRVGQQPTQPIQQPTSPQQPTGGDDRRGATSLSGSSTDISQKAVERRREQTDSGATVQRHGAIKLTSKQSEAAQRLAKLHVSSGHSQDDFAAKYKSKDNAFSSPLSRKEQEAFRKLQELENSVRDKFANLHRGKELQANAAKLTKQGFADYKVNPAALQIAQGLNAISKTAPLKELTGSQLQLSQDALAKGNGALRSATTALKAFADIPGTEQAQEALRILNTPILNDTFQSWGSPKDLTSLTPAQLDAAAEAIHTIKERIDTLAETIKGTL